MKMVSISLQLPQDVDNHFREIARKAMVSKSSVIRKILFDLAKAESEAPKQPNSTGRSK